MQEIKVIRTTQPKQKPDPATLVFGHTFTDHMFLMNYSTDAGWHDARIVPYGPFELAPSSMVFHYAQEVFEGLKAYRTPDGGVQLFRPEQNARRMNDSCDRLCIPRIPEELFLQALVELVKLEQDWVPSAPGTSLYLRPFVFATDPNLGVHASHTYLFAIICSPVGSYYPEGINPGKDLCGERRCPRRPGRHRLHQVRRQLRRLHPRRRAGRRAGYSQVLWLDGVHRKYIEEVGAMNVMFKVNGEILTPELTGSVLPASPAKAAWN